jgi:hypothetical protein
MKRTLVAIAVLGSLAVGFLAPGSSNAASGPPAPKKVDPKLTTVTGGNPWPLGLDGEYGYVRMTFPSPLAVEKLTSLKATCTPAAGTGADLTQFPDFILEQTFTLSQANPGVSPYTSTTPGFSNTAGNISLKLGPYVDPDNTGAAQYPSLKCGITVYNAKKPAGVVGKAQKIGTAPAADCGVGDASANPLWTGRDRGLPSAIADKTTLYMPVSIDVPALGLSFPYCTTGPDARARFNSDQQTDFTYSYKATNKKGVKTGTIKKLKLTAPLTHEIPLVVSGATVVYKYDPTVLQMTGPCVASVAKVGANTCSYNNATGTITLTSTDALTVKKDKPIVSPTVTVTFNYVNNTGAPTTTNITYDQSATTITIGPASVQVKLLSDDDQRTLLDLPACGTIVGLTESCPDPNEGYPLITLTLP